MKEGKKERRREEGGKEKRRSKKKESGTIERIERRGKKDMKYQASNHTNKQRSARREE